MDRKILDDILIFLTLMIGTGCLTGIFVTYFRRQSPRLPNDALTARLDEIADRLGRLETAVDTTALEVERIAEGQRFTTKLLADRSGASAFADRPRGGSATPH